MRCVAVDSATAGIDDACVGEHYKLRVAADSSAFGKGEKAAHGVG